ncbi:PIG-L family deacetylase [Patescibacteria group bacterium]|nr:PIG-L family deacetylase [Patescibacteria group bacterium]
MKALFIFAHPDDESFSSGATIAKLVQKKVSVKLITATRGEEGELGDPPLCLKKDLGKTREKELLESARILGIPRVYFLDFKDQTLKKTARSKLLKPIIKIMQDEKPDLVFTFSKDGASRHPDHVRISQVATYAFDLYAKTMTKHVRLYHTAMPRNNLKILHKHGVVYNAFGKITGIPNHRITTMVDIETAFDKKLQALKCHRTQMKDVARFIKTDRILNRRYEYFYLIREYNLI